MKEDYFEKLSALVASPNTSEDFQEAFISFKYTGNIPNPPSITIAGHKKVEAFNELFKQIYNQLHVEKHKISFKAFVKNAEQLFFSNSFNKKNVSDMIKEKSCTTYTNICKIYGVKLSQDILSFYDVKFVKKEYIIDFLKSTIIETADNKIWLEKLIEQKTVEISSNANFIYFVYNYDSFDSDYSKQMAEKCLSDTINIIRYMIGIKNERIYVDNTEFNDCLQHFDQFSSSGMILPSSKLIKKDIAFDLADPFFNATNNGNERIWEILSKPNKNQVEKKILKAIKWIGLSIEETQLDVACAEIAFAFESLLKADETSVISPSIQGQIADSVAFICGETADERIKIVNDFKTFYRYRSAIAHGAEKSTDINYQKYLNMIKNVVINLLTDDSLNKCTSLDELNSLINSKKYGCVNDNLD